MWTNNEIEYTKDSSCTVAEQINNYIDVKTEQFLINKNYFWYLIVYNTHYVHQYFFYSLNMNYEEYQCLQLPNIVSFVDYHPVSWGLSICTHENSVLNFISNTLFKVMRM